MAPSTQAIIPGVGGSHTINEAGELTSVAPTQDHPEGNAPRDAEGRKLYLGQPIVVEEEPAPPQPATAQPRARRREVTE